MKYKKWIVVGGLVLLVGISCWLLWIRLDPSRQVHIGPGGDQSQTPAWVAVFDDMSFEKMTMGLRELSRPDCHPSVGEVDKALELFSLKCADLDKKSDGDIEMALVVLKVMVSKQPGSIGARDRAFDAGIACNHRGLRSGVVDVFGQANSMTQHVAEGLAVLAATDEDLEIRQLSYDLLSSYVAFRGASQAKAWIEMDDVLHGKKKASIGDIVDRMKVLLEKN